MSKLFRVPNLTLHWLGRSSTVSHAFWKFLNNEAVLFRSQESKRRAASQQASPSVPRVLSPESPEGRPRERGPQSGFSLLLVFVFAFVFAFAFTLAFLFVLSLRRHPGFTRGPTVVDVSPPPPGPGSVSKETSTPSG